MTRAVPAILSAAALLTAPAAAQRVDTSAKAVLAAADAYLEAYQRQLTFLLADERTTQEVADESGGVTARRSTSGDLFVTYVRADRAWVAVHDTMQVDGKPVAGHEDLRRLLERDSVAGVARQLIARNARFNIGSVTRNFNEPTLGLLVLEPRRRSQFRFDRKGVERDGAATVVSLAFKETERPTLVRGLDGSELYSSGEMAIEAGTGRIRRTFMQLAYGPVVARLTTVYARDPNLNLWLPSTFTERYERAGRSAEVITCVATYTNWRKFDVEVRIK